MDVTTRADALCLDAEDPLAGFRGRFLVPDPDLIDLDDTSPGRLPLATAARLAEVRRAEWGRAAGPVVAGALVRPPAARR